MNNTSELDKLLALLNTKEVQPWKLEQRFFNLIHNIFIQYRPITFSVFYLLEITYKAHL